MTPQETIARGAEPRSIESLLEKRWARLLIPSLSDLFFVALLVWLFMSGGGTGWDSLLADGDVGWHIRTGEYILDTGSVPTEDLYSFSKAGQPWYAWEWLSDVIDGGLHRAAGLKGVVLLAALIIAGFGTTLIRRMFWHGSHMFVAVGVALLGVGSASIHFLARPHVFTLLFLSIAVWMIEADRRAPSRRIWLLVPLTAVWTNLHGGFLALIVVLGLTAAGTAGEAWLGAGRSYREALRWAQITGACLLASLVNPYGWNLHLHVIEYLQSDWIKNVIEEFQSPRFRDENMLQFEALMLVGLLVAAAQFRQRRLVEGLWIVAWAHLALSSARHVPIFVTVTAPVLAAQISQWWNAWTASAGKNSLAGILNAMAADSAAGFRRTSLLPFGVALALVLMGPPLRWPQDFPELVFPTRMVHEHAGLIAGSRVLTTDQWGDYLIYVNPEQKVFVDGRSDFYGPEVGKEYLQVTNGDWRWRRILDKYRFEAALMPVSSAIVQLLKREPDWKVVEDDGKNILLVRRTAAVLQAGKTPTEPRF